MSSEQHLPTVVHADPPSPDATALRWHEKARDWFRKLLGLVRRDPVVLDAPFDLPFESSIKSMVDPLKFEQLAFQRDVMAWRDEAHARVHADVQQLHQTFSAHIDAEMKQVSILKKVLFTTPADAMLKEAVAQLIIAPLKTSVARERDALAASSATPGKLLSCDSEETLGAGLADTNYAWLASVPFKPANQAEIDQRVHAWLLGPEGIATLIHSEITRAADELTESGRHAGQDSL